MSNRPDSVQRMLFALSENHYSIEKTRAWLEVFDRGALEALDDYEEEDARETENACNT